MITRNRTGKFSFLKYSVGVFAAIVITLLFACDRKTVDKKTSEPVTIVASTDNNTINSVPQDNGNAKEANSEKKMDSARLEEDVYIVVDQAATFQGNDLNSFGDWVCKNLKYPLVAAKREIKGRIYVEFVVSKDGIVRYAHVLKGADPILDQEAIRVIKSSPVWEPARQGGRKVAQQFIIPIEFALK